MALNASERKRATREREAEARALESARKAASKAATKARNAAAPFSLLHPRSALDALGASEAELRAELAVMASWLRPYRRRLQARTRGAASESQRRRGGDVAHINHSDVSYWICCRPPFAKS